MADTFELETHDGIRRVEFDPDVFRFRDVRVLVDGSRVAEMPYPKPHAPYREVAFELSGHSMVGMVHLSAEPTPGGPAGLVYDLFADGRSLTDGSSLAAARERAPAPGEAYPDSFRVIDMVLRVAPAASGPGIGVGVTSSGGQLGWPTVIGLLALMLGAVALATMLAWRAWARIRADATRSVASRTALGAAIALGCYVVAGAGVLAVAVRHRCREPVGALSQEWSGWLGPFTSRMLDRRSASAVVGSAGMGEPNWRYLCGATAPSTRAGARWEHRAYMCG